MEQCPKDRCVWASGGICVFPCMDKADYNRAQRRKAERDKLQRIAIEHAKRKRLIAEIQKYNTACTNRLLALKRRYKVKDVQEIPSDELEMYLAELRYERGCKEVEP